MKVVSTLAAPTARGHYSQALVHNGLVYVAGQLPLVPGEPERRLATFDEQARRVIDNVIAILEAAGSGADLILKATVYIADVEHWPAVGELKPVVYSQRNPDKWMFAPPDLPPDLPAD